MTSLAQNRQAATKGPLPSCSSWVSNANTLCQVWRSKSVWTLKYLKQRKGERICVSCVLPVLRLRQRVGSQSQNSDLELCDKAISRGSATQVSRYKHRRTPTLPMVIVLLSWEFKDLVAFSAGLVSLRATCLPSTSTTWRTNVWYWNRINQEHRFDVTRGFYLQPLYQSYAFVWWSRWWIRFWFDEAV